MQNLRRLDVNLSKDCDYSGVGPHSELCRAQPARESIDS